ncbi:MAG: isocitrate/isopropylmalate dehydrogenase family protein [Candidatus Omnitrophica bacterium]|jgi:isocitrate dehydrogenase (NAD+)|nr:isocitrate/isopropylmalate dehydrogenase family protein [Candidatus Omnitrophota bacterium]
MSYRISLIPGDGIGPEVTDAARLCIDTLGIDIRWDIVLAGEPALKQHNSLLPSETLNSIKKNKVALKGPITTPVGSGFRSINVALRQELDLYACVRPARYIEGTNSKHPGTDIIIVRENSEDLYAGVEFKELDEKTNGLINYINGISEKKVRIPSAISIKPISSFASERIIRFAFELAKREKRRKVSCIHKANIMKYTDGLFLQIFREIAKGYPQIEVNDVIVDNLCMQLVLRPHEFDVLVLPNLYGDIISDLCAGLIGGLGIAPGANIGETTALFEPVHGAAPKYTGKNKVNPTATILSAALMLKHIGEHKKADILEKAVAAVIKKGKNVTYDLKPTRTDPGSVGTKEMAEAIVEEIKKELKNG